jgi:hypothetical protein
MAHRGVEKMRNQLGMVREFPPIHKYVKLLMADVVKNKVSNWNARDYR